MTIVWATSVRPENASTDLSQTGRPFNSRKTFFSRGDRLPKRELRPAAATMTANLDKWIGSRFAVRWWSSIFQLLQNWPDHT